MDGRLADYVSALRRSESTRVGADQQTEPISITATIRSRRFVTGVLALLGVHALQIGFTFAGWAFIGAGALSGRVDRGWIIGWTLCIASAGICRLAAVWVEGLTSIGLAVAVRQSLLAGATTAAADVIQARGPASLMAAVLESESIEHLAVSGGFTTLLSLLELAAAMVALAWGAGAGVQVPLLVAWMALVAWLAAMQARARKLWTTARLALTEQLIDHMVAHRTRAVQQSAETRHVEEDRRLADYVDRSHDVDASTAGLEALLPRGYIVAALAALSPFVIAGHSSIAEQAITLGVILYAGRSLRALTFAYPRAVTAWIAWKAVQPIAAPPLEQKETDLAFASVSDTALRADDVTFTPQGRINPTVTACSLTLERGDFVLLEGDSASGKSTLVSLLAGRRRPSTGAIVSAGLDLPTVGARAWRRQIVAVPQYHDNHVLSASLAFNLLLGCPYPHTKQDVADAREVCEELGLGPLIRRMPSGLDQMVGETGWQLSHGERSRLFLARALLQRPAVLLLDETLAALDPDNVAECLQCVFRRAETALVVAHP